MEGGGRPCPFRLFPLELMGMECHFHSTRKWRTLHSHYKGNGRISKRCGARHAARGAARGVRRAVRGARRPFLLSEVGIRPFPLEWEWRVHHFLVEWNWHSIPTLGGKGGSPTALISLSVGMECSPLSLRMEMAVHSHSKGHGRIPTSFRRKSSTSIFHSKESSELDPSL